MEKFFKYISDNKDALTIIISTVLGLIALLTFIKAIVEYKLQGRQKRAELYNKFDNVFDEKEIKNIVAELEARTTNISNIPIVDRMWFLGLYEQIYLAINSRLINKEIAYYMFGAFALQCWNNDNFWNGIDKYSDDWLIFRLFIDEMHRVKNAKTKNKVLKRVLPKNYIIKRKFIH